MNYGKKIIWSVFFISLTTYLWVSLYFLDRVYFLCPIEYKGDVLVRYDSRGGGSFGSPRGGNRLHQGLDLLAKIGTGVLASRTGKVITVAKDNGMGNYIIIKHPHNFITLYGHLQQIYVTKNQWLRQGQVIATVGNTGNARYQGIQAHLHFEIRKNGIPQDPIEHLQ